MLLKVKDAEGQIQTIQSQTYGTPGSPGADVATVQGVAGGVMVGVELASYPLTNRSGTIAAANLSQVVAVAKTNRKGFWLQNLSNVDLYLNLDSTATLGGSSLRLVPGAYWEAPIGGAGVHQISIIGTIIGQAFASREW